jgi:glycerol uptake facilitator-like aquaporin
MSGRRIAAEFVGTALLLATIVGSGIMGERLAGGNVAIALLANSLATGAGLIALILTFMQVSGAHFNPLVSVIEACYGRLTPQRCLAYIGAQFTGAIAGVVTAHLMFGLPVVAFSQHQRSGLPQMLSETVATFGLITIILNCAKNRSDAVPYAVGAYITAAYWFTSSTSFANPAVTGARSLTDSFAGIRPTDAPGFVAAQIVGATLAALLFRWMGKASR